MIIKINLKKSRKVIEFKLPTTDTQSSLLDSIQTSITGSQWI